VSNLMELARRVAALGTVPVGEKGDKGEKSACPNTLSPLSPFSPAPVAPNSDPPLSSNEQWDSRVAARLMFDADTRVEQLGVDGRHPMIVNAATMVASAFATRDMETLRLALSEFVVCVREVSREQLLADGKGQAVAAKGANVLPLVGQG
jgi:hypothetical protein